MKKNKIYVVLGLGIYGSTLVEELSRHNLEVIAIDNNMSAVERISEYTPYAYCLDFTDKEQLKEVGVEKADIGIVCTGSHLEESIIGILNLKELGVGFISSKANNSTHAQIMEKIGANQVVTPEKEMGRRYAKQLMSDNILELFDIDATHSFLEMKVVKEWVGHSLIELNVRAKYGINIVGIKRNNKLNVSIDPNKPLQENDVLLVFGDTQYLAAL